MSDALGPSASYAQAPRFYLLLTIGGQSYALQNPLTMRVQTNNVREPARFSCSASVEPDTASFLSNQTDIQIDIQVALDDGSPVSLIYGLVDTFTFNPIDGTVELSGRDLSALLVDAPTQQTYANMTSSQIVQQFVNQWSQYGLQGNITATTKPVGRFYGIDYGMTIYQQLYRATTEWDLVLFLAQMEQFDARMEGRTLYFGPPLPDDGTIYELAMDFGPPVVTNFEKMLCTRSLTLAKDVEVSVLSWNSMLMKPIKKMVRSSGMNSPKGATGPAQQYVFYKPDLTPDQALQYAQAKLVDITKHERDINVSIPGELDLKPTSKVRIVGTGTTWDQDYFVQEIDREISFEGGFTETIRLKNLSPANQSVVF